MYLKLNNGEKLDVNFWSFLGLYIIMNLFVVFIVFGIFIIIGIFMGW